MVSAQEVLKEHLLNKRLESVQRRECDWVFLFNRGSSISLESLWRVLSERAIQITSEDDGQWFGLKAPLDAAAEARTKIGEGSVSDVQLDSASSDITISFSNGLRLQLVSTSSGYEAWHFCATGVEVIGRNADTVIISPQGS